jgi:hypothetical protein
MRRKCVKKRVENALIFKTRQKLKSGAENIAAHFFRNIFNF